MHVGDAYLHHGELDHTHPHMPIGLHLYERIMATDPKAAQNNLERLRFLGQTNNAVRIICSHDRHYLTGVGGENVAA